MRRSLLLAWLVVACGPKALAIDPRPAVVVLPSVDAGASAPALPAALGEVTVTFFDVEGGASWGPWGEPATDAATAIRPCYARALRDDPASAGWVRVSVPSGYEGTYAAATLLDHSPLPPPLVECVVLALRGLHRKQSLSAAPTIAYVSLR